MKNYFQATSENLYHLSVGAVLVNDKNEVVCHYFKKAPESAPGEYKGLKNAYFLMHETVERGELVEETLHRGLMEEFGATGDALSFLGSQEKVFKGNKVTAIKTTLYFLVRMKEIDLGRRSHEDIEGDSEIVFLPIGDCILNMKEQWDRLHCETLDESEIVERARDCFS